MSVLATVLVEPLQMSATQTVVYTAPPSTRVIIDKATVTNTDAIVRSFSVNLVPDGDTPGNDNLIVDTKAVLPGETYNCPELVGHVLLPGTEISAIATLGSALTLRISGREIT